MLHTRVYTRSVQVLHTRVYTRREREACCAEYSSLPLGPEACCAEYPPPSLGPEACCAESLPFLLRTWACCAESLPSSVVIPVSLLVDNSPSLYNSALCSGFPRLFPAVSRFTVGVYSRSLSRFTVGLCASPVSLLVRSLRPGPCVRHIPDIPGFP